MGAEAPGREAAAAVAEQPGQHESQREEVAQKGDLEGVHALASVGAPAVAEQADRPVHEGEEEGRHRHVEGALDRCGEAGAARSEEHTSELQSLMRSSYAAC